VRGELSAVLFKKRRDEEPHEGQVDQCVACFKKGINCTQAVASTYGGQFGLDAETALKIAAAFGSGMGMGETCGAVTGALMVIGLKHSKTAGSRLLSKDKTEEIAHEFTERFKARHGTVVCRELLGCDVTTSAGLKTAKQEKHFKKRCPEYVKDAAMILEELLKD
jgi:C_GCAxxG_C_C family probable redox protein